MDHLCICGCGEPAVLAARHCHKRLRVSITADDYTVEDRGFETPCWVWKGRKGNDRYALVRLAGREVYVHRAMYEQEVGPIPRAHVVDHLCRVHRCIRPQHLEAVTRAENTRRGLAAKLTREQADDARDSDESAREAAARLGVSEYTVYQIRSGKTWREEEHQSAQSM